MKVDFNAFLKVIPLAASMAINNKSYKAILGNKNENPLKTTRSMTLKR